MRLVIIEKPTPRNTVVSFCNRKRGAPQTFYFATQTSHARLTLLLAVKRLRNLTSLTPNVKVYSY